MTKTVFHINNVHYSSQVSQSMGKLRLNNSLFISDDLLTDLYTIKTFLICRVCESCSFGCCFSHKSPS